MSRFQPLPFVRHQAGDLIASNLKSDDRVLVTGASGWFGQTLASHLINLEVPSVFLASDPKVVSSGSLEFSTQRLDEKSIREFGPTVIFDFAALTRDRLSEYEATELLEINENLSKSTVSLMQLESVRLVFCTSSGATVGQLKKGALEDLEAYARSKILVEKIFQEVANRHHKQVVCLRPWSVSGPLLRSRDKYAFSSIVQQSLEGAIRISAENLVLRRYVSVDDFLAGALWQSAHKTDSFFSIFDSGGELVELEILANIAAKLAGVDPALVLRPPIRREPNMYFSDNVTWTSFLDQSGYDAEDLEMQVLRVQNAFRLTKDQYD